MNIGSDLIKTEIRLHATFCIINELAVIRARRISGQVSNHVPEYMMS
jgi:hypothetical protein